MLRFLIPVFLLISSISFARAADPFYGKMVYAVPSDHKEYNAALEDLAAYLKKITGKHFEISRTTPSSGAGIFLTLNARDLSSLDLQKRLAQGSIEDFVLAGGPERLLIVARHPSGLVKGIYTYLDSLGVKWYLPGTRWEHFVNRNSIIHTGTAYITPSFSARSFFGTGGIRPVSLIDPGQYVAKEWEEWKRRNRMGSQTDLVGHYGEAFNTNRRKELESHPEYLAKLDGRRVPWSVAVKWCVSNKAFRNMFVEDRVSELKTILQRKDYPFDKIVLSVDPADGGGHCECDDCKKLGSVSDRYSLLSNETAKAFAALSPRAQVSLMAYYQHAAPPRFALEPNVMVIVVPYAFQEATQPEQLIHSWTRLHKNVLMYDYFFVPDWQFDVPAASKTSLQLQKLRFWHAKGVKGFNLESSYGTGSAGLGLYLLARLGWDVNSDVQALQRSFFTNMFKASAAQAAKYYEYLNQSVTDAAALPHLRLLLNEMKGGADLAVRERIGELEAHLHYLFLLYRWQSAKEVAGAEWAELNRYVWEIYPLKVVHSTRIAELLYHRLPANHPFMQDWSMVPPFGNALRKVQPASRSRIEQLVKQDASADPVLDAFPYARAKPADYQLTSKKSSFSEHLILGNNFPSTYIRPAASGTIRFSLKLNDAETAGEQAITVQCVDTAKGTVIYSSWQTLTRQWKEISFVLPAGNTYRLMLEGKPWIRIRVPHEQWLAFTEIPPYSVMDSLWFRVPPQTKYFYYSNTSADQPRFSSSGNVQQLPEKAGPENMFRLKTGSTKEVWWAISSSQYKHLRFYNLPVLFFTHPGYRAVD